MKNENFIAKTYKKLVNSSIDKKTKVVESLDENQLQLLLGFINKHKVMSDNTNYMQDELLSVLVKKEIKNRVDSSKKI
jgi:hypothetical protein